MTTRAAALGHTRAEMKFLWYPKQERLAWLLNDPSNDHITEIGFGGARGGGKSHGGRQLILDRALRYSNTTHLVFRRTRKELWGNHIRPLFKAYPFLRAFWNQETFELSLPNGSVIEFGYAEHNTGENKDIEKFQGREYATILVDEATHNTEEVVNFLRMCCRYTGEHNLVPKMLYTMNPGNRGHAYFKRVFIERNFTANEDPNTFVFVASYSWDNYEWITPAERAKHGLTPHRYYFEMADEERFKFFIGNTAYGRKLNALPHTERLQHLMGDWDVFAGMYFAEFRRDLHVIKPFKIPAYWERFCAADWGYTSPACNLWFAVSPDEWLHITQSDGRVVTLPPRTVVVYRERYLTKHTSVMLAKDWNQHTFGEPIKYRLLDPAFGPTRGGGVSISEEMAGSGWVTVPADNERILGWSRVRNYLAWKRDEKSGEYTAFPHLYIFETCENLCRTLPQLIYDEKDTEDLDTEGEDHAADALRYGLMSRPPVTVVPIEQMDEDYAEAILRANHNEGRFV